jgi:predicted NBD/HSP70 family sugar kinase
MEQYIGLDVSLKETHICVVDGSGAVVARCREATHPGNGVRKWGHRKWGQVLKREAS